MAQALLERALAQGWSASLGREVDDLELYLSTEIERFEDMDPTFVTDARANSRLIDGLGAMVEALTSLRSTGEVGGLVEDAATLRAAFQEAASTLASATDPSL